MKNKCPDSGFLVEDVLPVGWEFDDKVVMAKLKGSEPFAVRCTCGKVVKTTLRGNNWRIPAHATPATVEGEAMNVVRIEVTAGMLGWMAHVESPDGRRAMFAGHTTKARALKAARAFCDQRFGRGKWKQEAT